MMGRYVLKSDKIAIISPESNPIGVRMHRVMPLFFHPMMPTIGSELGD